ncbi:unnamed protein product [Cuscuta campestris]|uniref:WIT1/2 N-terminal helical bundle domain-containing protein n=1 Tax=Cuscuta campestris TaxID=132261 RepID=A0A484KR24_9ASTE|nr:unnamed protein product [Cuscuta campestris]
MELLSRVNLDIAYSSEKLANLGQLLTIVLAKQEEVEEAMAVENEDDNDSVDSVEKALTLHHLNVLLKAELRQLDDFVSRVHDLILETRQKICSQEEENEFHSSEESLGQLKEGILKMKMQLDRPLMVGSLFSDQDEWRHGLNLKPQEKRVLRMLEKSLAREVELEKKIKAMKQNEDDLKLKLGLREQVTLHMEEAAEVIWGRFLEAENTVEVLMGISKDMVGRLEMANLNVNSSLQRERDLQSKLETCMENSNAKDLTIHNLDKSVALLQAGNSEARKNIEKLEQKLSASESKLTHVNSSVKVARDQIKEMESEIESLREGAYQLESRAESAEAKALQLEETNLELSEELSFLKDNNEKKANLLEKDVRELEIQLQNSKASSEASQEQQNMLYSAIWDMETLIDELKQKVSVAENKTEVAEEQCIVLSELNSELNAEIVNLRDRVGSLEASLSKANAEKMASAKDINVKTKFIMELVMELAVERERVQKQLCCLTKENKLLTKRLQMNRSSENKEQLPFTENFVVQENPQEVPVESSLRSTQVEDVDDNALHVETGNELLSSSSPVNGEIAVVEHERNRHRKSRRRAFMAILILLLSVSALLLYGRIHTFANYGG